MNEKKADFFQLKVITPRQLLVDGQVEEAALPGLEGELGILPGHRELFVALGKGTLRYRRSGTESRFEVKGGYAEIGPESVLVFTSLSDDEESRA